MTTTSSCVWCGRTFPNYDQGNQAFTCSRACQLKRWRAIKMLEGTHGWVDGKFARLPLVVEA